MSLGFGYSEWGGLFGSVVSVSFFSWTFMPVLNEGNSSIMFWLSEIVIFLDVFKLSLKNPSFN